MKLLKPNIYLKYIKYQMLKIKKKTVIENVYVYA